ncbi:MAG: class I SAM-dependent methyltransferase [Acidobacteriota bacterium]|nr:class I SAM-dependent methyltransferase [Acidobacteriota bacterium]
MNKPLRSASSFRDHFSSHAADYARYRPDYPGALFDFLASLAPARRRAWDCATGNGQAAAGLAARFQEVVGTDASALQIAAAVAKPGVLYRVAFADASGLPNGSVDLVTVAQALHWLDRDRFWPEADRVLAAGGVIAVWCYDLLRITPEVDAVVRRLSAEVVGPYWPPERALVERGYGTLEFPFEEVPAPAFAMGKLWTFPDLLGYLRTWSANRRFEESTGDDPLRIVESELRAAWGEPGDARTARWDLDLRVGRKR